jgi:hypothetical protein
MQGFVKTCFGRWLGVSHRVGNLMLYCILTIACRVISRTTVQRITHLELTTSEVKDRCKEYNERIKEIMHDNNHQIAGNKEERRLQDWDETRIYRTIQYSAKNFFKFRTNYTG